MCSRVRVRKQSHDRDVSTPSHITAISESHIHSFRRRGMERPAGSRHSCAVTRGLQTAP